MNVNGIATAPAIVQLTGSPAAPRMTPKLDSEPISNLKKLRSCGFFALPMLVGNARFVRATFAA